MGMNPIPETIKNGRLLIGFRIFMAVDPIPRIPNLERASVWMISMARSY